MRDDNNISKAVESELLYKTLFENSADAIMTLEPPDWKFTNGNKSTLKMFMADNQVQFESAEPWKLSPEKQPDGRLSSEKAKEMIELAMNNGYNFFEWTHKRLNGEEFAANVLLSRIVLPEKTFLQATVRDLSKFKKTQEKMQDSERMLQGIIDLLPTRIFWKDLNLNLLGCNKAFALDAGHENFQEILGKSDFEMPWKEQAERYRADDMAVINSGQQKLNYEEPQTTPDGKIIWLSTNKVPLKDGTGKIIGVLGTYLDITKEKLVEKDIEEKMIQLEKINEIMVDRELKMIELKNQITELEKKIGEK